MRFNTGSPTGRANIRFGLSLLLNLAVGYYLLQDLGYLSPSTPSVQDLDFGEGDKVDLAPIRRPDRAEKVAPALIPRARTCGPCESAQAICAEIG
jgi:hypothetical protein